MNDDVKAVVIMAGVAGAFLIAWGLAMVAPVVLIVLLGTFILFTIHYLIKDLIADDRKNQEFEDRFKTLDQLYPPRKKR